MLSSQFLEDFRGFLSFLSGFLSGKETWKSDKSVPSAGLSIIIPNPSQNTSIGVLGRVWSNSLEGKSPMQESSRAPSVRDGHSQRAIPPT